MIHFWVSASDIDALTRNKNYPRVTVESAWEYLPYNSQIIVSPGRSCIEAVARKPISSKRFIPGRLIVWHGVHIVSHLR